MNENNLNVVRLVAAWLVLYGHSFVFLGLPEPLFLNWISLGSLGVYIFFTISGYLISISWIHDPHLGRFFIRRLLRIIPALFICVFLTVLFLGPALTSLPLRDYFENQHTWGYLRTICLYTVYYLPGVFETNRVPVAVNGSLWTLPVEFTLYILLAMIGFMTKNRWIYLIIAIFSIIITIFWALREPEMLVVYNYDLRQLFFCGTYFWIGCVFHIFDIKRYFNQTLTILAFIALISLEPWPYALSIMSWILLPIIILSFGLAYSNRLYVLTKSGDYSYGIYIYAFPIQQTVVSLYPNMGIEKYLVLCTVLTCICATLSWHLIEKKALSIKPKRKFIIP